MNDYYNQYDNYTYSQMYNPYRINPYIQNIPMDIMQNQIQIKDYGNEPIIVDINSLAKQNNYYRNTLWTGEHLQVVLMSINVNESIGLEVHPNLDQFVYIEQGHGIVMIGDDKDSLDYKKIVSRGFAFIIPAGKWHNFTNTSNIPVKLYTIYAPPEHKPGTIHKTKAEEKEI
jgi:mannose-6-phosphate isomerase-like protein (cupin superfamily)